MEGEVVVPLDAMLGDCEVSRLMEREDFRVRLTVLFPMMRLGECSFLY